MNDQKKIDFAYGFYSDNLRECFDKFGSLFDLPVVKFPKEIVDNYKQGNILDIGAGKEKPMEDYLDGKISSGKYYSLDNDPEGKFDFGDIDDVKDLKFSLITANQVFEHLDLSESLDLIKKSADLLEKDGKIVITVPNVQHPNRQISNVTHKTPWGHDSLYALCRYAGLKVEKIGRYGKRRTRGPIELFVAWNIQKIYRMDWCDSVMIIATKS